ncbi:MAG: methyltransferase domain-containing protein [Methanosarcinaceae archaeon]|nr:methyltransferase domain-containing protein [Methanosarcinaceae archaeon]
MKLRKLEMILESVSDFKEPDPSLEQYKTPATLSAKLIHMAFMSGDIENKIVYDFGCGTGILAIASALLGAKKVIGFDIDKIAIEDAKKNAKDICESAVAGKTDISFIRCDISEIPGFIENKKIERADTIVMNPPFGAQKKGNDRPFMKSALESGNIIYSIHNKGSYNFMEKFIRPARITDSFESEFQIKRTFDFHTKEKMAIPVEIYRIENI